jgi:hypothetical protein
MQQAASIQLPSRQLNQNRTQRCCSRHQPSSNVDMCMNQILCSCEPLLGTFCQVRQGMGMARCAYIIAITSVHLSAPSHDVHAAHHCPAQHPSPHCRMYIAVHFSVHQGTTHHPHTGIHRILQYMSVPLYITVQLSSHTPPHHLWYISAHLSICTTRYSSPVITHTNLSLLSPMVKQHNTK